MDDLLRLFGRFHFALNHFPVALVCVAAGLEGWRFVRRKDSCAGATPLLIALGTIGAIVAAASGWANADFETHGLSVAEELERHRWMGVGTAALMVVALILSIRARDDRSILPMRVFLWLAAGLVSFAGHVGGELVHGEGYLTSFMEERPVSRPILPIEPIEPSEPTEEGTSLNVVPARVSPTYAELALPVFQKHCVSCHGPDKQKSKLRLDQYEDIFREDRGTWLVVAGKPEESELIRRITLPAEDFDIMPPEGNPLSSGEIDALRRWVQAGALR